MCVYIFIEMYLKSGDNFSCKKAEDIILISFTELKNGNKVSAVVHTVQAPLSYNTTYVL